MKIRNGFISNSSSSSFVLPDDVDIDKDEVLNFCKEKLTKVFEERIEEVKRLKSKYCSNWKQVITFYEEDIKNLDDTIKISTVKDFEWDLDDFVNPDQCTSETLILYDEQDNLLNLIDEELVKRYNIKHYATHI